MTQEEWEDAELLPDMTTDARRWFLAERKRRQKGGHDTILKAPSAEDELAHRAITREPRKERAG